MPAERNHPFFNRGSNYPHQQSSPIIQNSFSRESSSPFPSQTSAPSIANESTSIISENEKHNGTVSSWIWNYGTKVENLWRCNICPRASAIQYKLGGTSNPAKHLTSKHGITKDGKRSTNQMPIEAGIRPVIDAKILRKLIVKWIVDRRQAFNEVEAESFRQIITYIDNTAVNKIPRSGNTLRNDLLKYYEEAKIIIAQQLSIARSRIHLSFDLSTSSNCKAFLGITAHWTSYDHKVKATLLAIRELEEEHTGENISEFVYDVAKEYGIEKKLGYFMMDNAGNNKTAVEHLSRRLQEEGYDGFDPVDHRLRCFAHVLNLVVKELLGKVEKKKGERISVEIVNLEEERKRWRALGAVGKLHNIVKHIRGNPQHRAIYIHQQIEELERKIRMMEQDNDTRWNSTWNMIQSALPKQQIIDCYVESVPGLQADKLTTTDWEDLNMLAKLLEPFKKLTLMGEERGTMYGTLNSVLWEYDLLLSKLETEKRKPRRDGPFKAAIDLAWKKLDGYYKKTDDSIAYIIATILDPTMKMDYFNRQWPADWQEGAKKKMCKAFDETKKKYDAEIERHRIPLISNRNLSTNTETIDVYHWRFGPSNQSKEDELEKYLKDRLVIFQTQEALENFDLLQ